MPPAGNNSGAHCDLKDSFPLKFYSGINEKEQLIFPLLFSKAVLLATIDATMSLCQALCYVLCVHCLI